MSPSIQELIEIIKELNFWSKHQENPKAAETMRKASAYLEDQLDALQDVVGRF